MSMVHQNRILSRKETLLAGLASGLICYLIAEALAPQTNTTPTDHDMQLAINLGFIYTPYVGVWLGWQQRSVRRAAIGAVVGIALAVLYMLLCYTKSFFLIMVGFPTLLGAGLAMFVGSNRSPWISRFLSRGLKGMVAGFSLGLIYDVVLNVTGYFLLGFDCPDTKAYIDMMWRAGPVSLSFASAAFFPLISKAVELDTSENETPETAGL